MATAKKTTTPAAESITDQVKTMDDVYRIQGTTSAKFLKSCKGLRDDEIANRQIELLALTLNEGTEMKVSNTKQWKYVPWFEVKKTRSKTKPAGFGLSYLDFDFSRTAAYLGARLAFKTWDLAKYAGTQFTDLYERAFS